jgi:hypothetical protein
LTTPVFKHFQIITPKDSSARTVLALGNGDPLLIEQSVHRGRVLLLATSAELAWTALPLWPSFVPLVQEIVARCAVGPAEQRNVTAGDTVAANVADTMQSGIFTAKSSGSASRGQMLAVNVDTSESDLTQLSSEALRADVWPGVPFAYCTAGQDAAAAVVALARGRNRFHVDLLYVALALLFFEIALAWKMDGGRQ